MVLILERRRAKVDKTDFRVQKNLSLRGLPTYSRGGRRDLAVVGKCLVVVATE